MRLVLVAQLRDPASGFAEPFGEQVRLASQVAYLVRDVVPARVVAFEGFAEGFGRAPVQIAVEVAGLRLFVGAVAPRSDASIWVSSGSELATS